MDTNKIIMDCHNIARGIAPRRSGNLRNNAIKITNRSSKGFTITYSATDAFYIKFVEEGTKNQRAQGFIEKTYLHLANYLHEIGNGKNAKYKIANQQYKVKGERELFTENTDYRKLMHRQSIFQYYQTEGRQYKDGSDLLYRR